MEALGAEGRREEGVSSDSSSVLTVFLSLPLPLFLFFFTLSSFLEIDKCGVDCLVVEMLSSPGTNQNLD